MPPIRIPHSAIRNFPHLIVFPDPTPGDGPHNMAVDQALLELATAPVLRAYRWSRPYLSIGYFQRLSDIENPENLPVVRRWTGGGTVPHIDDWTFSLIVPKPHPFSAITPAESYCIIHRAVAAALEESGFPNLALSSAPPPISPSRSCFTAPVADDILCGTQKIAGGAQRRSKLGLLHQGSIQSLTPPPSFLTTLASHLAQSQSQKLSLTPQEQSQTRPPSALPLQHPRLAPKTLDL